MLKNQRKEFKKMKEKYACVVDAEGHYKTLVLIIIETNPETGQELPQVQHYTLQEGEALVETAVPPLRLHAGTPGFVRPRWDGGKWVEAAKKAEITAWEAEHPDPNARTPEEWLADKLAELSAACNAAITAGCDVTLSTGTGHITLTAEDQINLSTALAAVEQGAEGYPYHLDGQLCAVFPAADIRVCAQTATAHKLEHTTYYNHLAAWVRRTEAAEDLEAITYGAALPEDLEANMAAILAAAEGGEANV